MNAQKTSGGSAPAQTMAEFFARADVREQQEIQKRHPYKIRTHHDAFLRLRRLAFEINAADWIGDY